MKKRRLKTTLIVCLTVLLVLPSFGWGVGLANENGIFAGHTDLSKAKIETFSVGQDIKNSKDDLILKYDVEDMVSYCVAGYEQINILTKPHSDKIYSIYAFGQDEDSDKNMLLPSIEGLTIDKSSFSEVVAVFGEKYTKVWFSETAEKTIVYRDSKSKLIMHCYFNNDILVGVNIESIG